MNKKKMHDQHFPLVKLDMINEWIRLYQIDKFYHSTGIFVNFRTSMHL